MAEQGRPTMPTRRSSCAARPIGAGIRASGWRRRRSMLKGFRIVARRYRTKLGEIDLIARRGNLVLIVEVKAREDADGGDGGDRLRVGAAHRGRRRPLADAPARSRKTVDALRHGGRCCPGAGRCMWKTSFTVVTEPREAGLECVADSARAGYRAHRRRDSFAPKETKMTALPDRLSTRSQEPFLQRRAARKAACASCSTARSAPTSRSIA